MSGFSRETELIEYVCIQKQIHYKDLAHMTLEAGESRVCSVGWKPGHPEKTMVQIKLKYCLLGSSF